MDSDLDDMFLILNFLKICKMYKNLKRKRLRGRSKQLMESFASQEHSKQEKSAKKSCREVRAFHSVSQQREDQGSRMTTTPAKESRHEIRRFQSVVQPDSQLEEITEETNVEQEHYGDDNVLITKEPLELTHDAYAGQDCQYQISFEVNGEQRHVFLGKTEEIQTETAFEFQENAEISCEEIVQQDEGLVENTEEILTDPCDEDTEIIYDPQDLIEEIPDEAAVVVPKKRRRRRRRGQNADQEEEPCRPIEKKPRIRHFKVRPENLNRHQEGFFGNVFLNIKSTDEEQFLLLTRMKPENFEMLKKLLFKPLSKRAQHVHAEERISITLLYLAHATPFEVIANKYKVGKTTVRNIILETCEVIYEILAPLYMREPNSEDYLNIAQDFKTLWKLPNCVGVIEGRHVSMKKPRRTILEEYHVKDMTSLVIVAACDAKHLFRSATVTVEPHQSSFGKSLMNNILPLPPNSPLGSDSNIDFPFYFIGNSSFPLRSNIMQPYTSSNLDDKKIFYNYRLSYGQSAMETTFSILTSLWRVLLTNLDVTPLICESIIMACIVLHNFVMVHGEDRWHNADGTFNKELPHYVNEDTEWINVETIQYKPCLEAIDKFGGESSDVGHELRDTLADYFYNEGSTETQNELLDI